MTGASVRGKRGCSNGADCSLVDGLGRVGLVGRCCLREPVGYVRRLFECCRIILLKSGVWRPASGWAGCLRAVGMDAQTCLQGPAFWRRDAVALLRRPSARSARRVIASGTWPTSNESNDRTIGGRCGCLRSGRFASDSRGPSLHFVIDKPQSSVHADRVLVGRVMERPKAVVSAGAGESDS